MPQHEYQKRGRELSGPRPGEFPIGSEASRAAARAMLNARAVESGEVPDNILVINMAKALALGVGGCIRILDDCGLLPRNGTRVVRLDKIPDGLDAAGLEKFIRDGGLTN